MFAVGGQGVIGAADRVGCPRISTGRGFHQRSGFGHHAGFYAAGDATGQPGRGICGSLAKKRGVGALQPGAWDPSAAVAAAALAHCRARPLAGDPLGVCGAVAGELCRLGSDPVFCSCRAGDFAADPAEARAAGGQLPVHHHDDGFADRRVCRGGAAVNPGRSLGTPLVAGLGSGAGAVGGGSLPLGGIPAIAAATPREAGAPALGSPSPLGRSPAWACTMSARCP